MRPACRGRVPGETLPTSLLFPSQALNPSSGDPNPPHWGLGSAGGVSQTRACRPGQWGGLVPPLGSGGGQAWGSPCVLQVLYFYQNHHLSEDGVLGAASLPVPPHWCAHAVAGMHTSVHVCVLCASTLEGGCLCPATAPTCAVPVVCLCHPLGFPEPKPWVVRL